jgi:hypothetical protein
MKRAASLVLMPMHNEENEGLLGVIDHKRQIISLAGGFLVSVAGFALIILLFAYIPDLVLSHADSVLRFGNFPKSGLVLPCLPLAILFFALMPGLVAFRRQQSKHSLHKV